MAGNSAVATSTLDPMFQDPGFYTFWPQLEGTPHNTVHTWTAEPWAGPRPRRIPCSGCTTA